jgi:putative nucleotidyltransferase with HDIG domain
VLDLDSLAQAASNLDPLPASVARLAAVVASADPDLDEILDVVKYDEALTATLLRGANSAASGSLTPVTNVRDAVIRLGTGSVLWLAVQSSVRRRLQRSVPEYGLTEGDLWRHSVATSLAAAALNRYAGVSIPAEAPTAALLHDIGKLLMCRFLGDDVLETIHRAQFDGGLTRIAAEVEILGVHHAELGGLMVQFWGFPESIQRGISYHHTPDDGVDRICYVTHLADVVAKSIGGLRDDNPDLEAFAHSMLELDLNLDDYDRLSTETEITYAEVLDSYE